MCQSCNTATISPATDKLAELGFKLDANGKLLKVTKSREIPKSLATLRGQMDSEDFEEFASEYLEQFPIVPRIAKGEDIHEVFEKHRPGSCMGYHNKRELREVYADNPDDVVVAYWLKDDHELLESDGSALLWLGKDRIYFDRVYSHGFSVQASKIICSICQHLTQRYFRPLVTIHARYSGLEFYTGRVSFRLSHPSDRLLPYADTLNRVADYDSDTVKLSTEDGDVCLDAVDGKTPDDESGQECIECGDRVDEDDAQYTENGDCLCEHCAGYCEWCEQTMPYNDLSFEQDVEHERRYLDSSIHICECCISDDFTRTEHGTLCLDSMLVESVEGHELSPNDIENHDYVTLDFGDNAGEVCELDNAVHLEYCDGYAYCDEVIQTHDGTNALEVDCVELHNGEYAIDENDEIVELHNGERALAEDCVETIDGENALSEDCRETADGEYELIRRRKPPQREFIRFDDDCSHTMNVIPGLPFAVCVNRYSPSIKVRHLPTDLNASPTNYRDMQTARIAILRLWESLSDEMRNDCMSADPALYQTAPGLGRIMHERLSALA